MIFIGSTGVGRAVMRDAADSLTPVTLELGGKDPFVVCGDARVAEVVPTALRAAFQSCGQNCVAAERFIVHEAVYDEFLERCTAITAHLRQGDPLGAMQSTAALAWHGCMHVSVPSQSGRMPPRRVLFSNGCFSQWCCQGSSCSSRPLLPTV